MQALLDHVRKGGDEAGFLVRYPELEAAALKAVVSLALEQLIQRERVAAAPPQGSLLPRYDDQGVLVNAAELRASLVTHRKVLCPACRVLVFRRWPEGWDAHAEHRCSGITAIEPAARKREFKRRYAHLFK